MNFMGMGITEIAIVLLIAILVFGPESVPKVATQLGNFMRSFRKITSGLTKDFSKAMEAENKANSKKSASGGTSQSVKQDIQGIKESLSGMPSVKDLNPANIIKKEAKKAITGGEEKSLSEFLGLDGGKKKK
jgi:sec-independent protein translocase protein TatA